jgi:hypothetical protein
VGCLWHSCSPCGLDGCVAARPCPDRGRGLYRPSVTVPRPSLRAYTRGRAGPGLRLRLPLRARGQRSASSRKARSPTRASRAPCGAAIPTAAGSSFQPGKGPTSSFRPGGTTGRARAGAVREREWRRTQVSRSTPACRRMRESTRTSSLRRTGPNGGMAYAIALIVSSCPSTTGSGRFGETPVLARGSLTSRP